MDVIATVSMMCVQHVLMMFVAIVLVRRLRKGCTADLKKIATQIKAPSWKTGSRLFSHPTPTRSENKKLFFKKLVDSFLLYAILVL